MASTLSSGQERRILRKLGINETYQLAMYQLDQYRGTILSCRYVIPPHLVPTEFRSQLEEHFRKAVVKTILRHPMTQVAMVDTASKTPSWAQLQSLDLKQHIQWVDVTKNVDFETTVRRTFCTQLDEYFPDLTLEQPGWKITILRQEASPVMDVLLTFNHPQFDGTGAKVLHEDLLGDLNQAGNKSGEPPGLHGGILTLPETTILPMPLEIVKPLPVSFKALAKAFWEDIRPPILTRDPSLANWCPIQATPYKTQYRSFFIEGTSLGMILGLCRKNDTTITGLLNGLALIAFAARLEHARASAFQSSTMVDHRRHLPPAPADAPWRRSDKAVSNYVTQCLHKFEVNEVARIRCELPVDAVSDESKFELSADLQTSLWRVASQNRTDIQRKLDSGLKDDIVGIFKWVTDWKQTMSDMAKKPRQFSWLITNLGVMDGNNTKVDDSGSGDAGAKEWSIDRAEFGLSAEMPAAAIEISAVSVAGKGMVVSANWPDCAVDVEIGEQIVGDLERWLRQLGRQTA